MILQKLIARFFGITAMLRTTRFKPFQRRPKRNRNLTESYGHQLNKSESQQYISSLRLDAVSEPPFGFS